MCLCYNTHVLIRACVCVYVSVCVFMCVCERQWVRVHFCVCARVFVGVCVWVSALGVFVHTRSERKKLGLLRHTP